MFSYAVFYFDLDVCIIATYSFAVFLRYFISSVVVQLLTMLLWVVFAGSTNMPASQQRFDVLRYTRGPASSKTRLVYTDIRIKFYSRSVAVSTRPSYTPNAPGGTGASECPESAAGGTTTTTTTTTTPSVGISCTMWTLLLPSCTRRKNTAYLD